MRLCLSICLSVNVSLCMSVCLFVYLSVNPSDCCSDVCNIELIFNQNFLSHPFGPAFFPILHTLNTLFLILPQSSFLVILYLTSFLFLLFFLTIYNISIISELTSKVDTLKVSLFTVMLVLQFVHLTELSSVSPFGGKK